MPPRVINNARYHDPNLARGKPTNAKVVPSFTPPSNIIASAEELQVLKYALQFYMYMENMQKISGKVGLAEITPAQKELATQILKRIL